ncbi:MAG: arylsulfatase [Planctomycetota bacterium]
MDRRSFLRHLGAGATALALPSRLLAGEAPRAPRPNIVIVLVDDMGYSDLGCYGGEIRTPHIDRLAHKGIRFTQFYNTAKCAPTRTSLLSGLYWQRAGRGIKSGFTMGHALGTAGYVTMAIGKWHLRGTPETRGFDRAFGHISGCTHYFHGDKSWHLDGEKFTVPEDGFYATDADTDYAIRFIEQEHRKAPDKPFLLYLAYNAPHYPLHALPEDIDRYRGQFRKGWDRLREERYARQLTMGLVKKDWALSPRPDYVPAWDSLSDEEKDFEDLRMAVYAAMIHRVDVGVGRLMAKLRELGVEENTLVLFLSDNGGCPFDRRRKGTPGQPDSWWEYGPAWATLSNTPYRLYKRNQHEGGIATPLIACWPAAIRDGGRIDDTPGHLIDLMPTVLALAAATYPKAHDGEALPPLPGRSLVPAFQGKNPEPRDALYFQYGPNRAVIAGDWKLVSAFNRPWELYRLDTDRTELHDLADERPDKAKALDALYRRWCRDIGIKDGFTLKPGRRGVPPYRSVLDRGKRGGKRKKGKG